MTYEQFIATKKELSNMDEIADAMVKAGHIRRKLDYDGWADMAWTYMDQYIIQCYGGMYHLIIGDAAQALRDLNLLEKELYDWISKL